MFNPKIFLKLLKFQQNTWRNLENFIKILKVLDIDQ